MLIELGQQQQNTSHGNSGVVSVVEYGHSHLKIRTCSDRRRDEAYFQCHELSSGIWGGTQVQKG